MFLKMLKEALKEGEVTSDEAKMLKKVDTYYGHYDKELKKAASDFFITPDESRKLKEIRNRIYEKAYFEAIKDGVITEDERAILKKLQQTADITDEEIRAIEEKVEEGESK